mgnify:CR=1 FL=1
MSEELIRLSDLTMTFEDGETILDHINLYIRNKEFLTLLGPSGCGKTTTLRIIGGFLTPTSGDVFFNGQRVNDVPPYKRKINTVFQKYALFPHLDVYDNIAFGLRLLKLSEQEIDEINILQATFLAMERAMAQLAPLPELALIDGNRSKDFGLPVRTIVKGDSLSASIAAASILAKVTRDRLMEQYDEQYPQYGFAVHKGYGTKRHYAALREYGPCPIHRQTFLKKFYAGT